MKKTPKLLLVLAASTMVLAACGGKEGNSSSDDSSATSEVIEEQYRVLVTCPNGIEYQISHEYAKKGEEITLTITNIAGGYSISSVTMNNRALQAEGDNVYKFNMPNQSASIVIRAAISGDVVINGDFTAKLEKEGNIYVARNVKVETSGLAYFSYEVKGSNDEVTKLDVLDFDESRSFGDIHIGNKTYALAVMGGSTYDFYFDPASSEAPCYIQRVKVDNLPESVSALSSVLITSYSVRSEPAVYKNNYVGAHYKVLDRSTSDVIAQEYDWKLYENESFATVTDTLDPDADEMYVYKKKDMTNNLYTVVDTYARNMGKKMQNDDRYREEYNGFGAYSGVWNIMEGDDYEFRFSKNTRNVDRNIRTSSHMPAYFIERDIMYAYRVGYTADEMTSSNVSIASEATANGFNTKINSYIEYNSQSGTYTKEMKEAYVFAVDMDFDVSGALTTLSYTKTVFNTENQWDFTAHKPVTGVKGNKVVTIAAEYTYGNRYEGHPDFDVTPYFISSFDNVQLYNPATGKDKSDGKSYVSLGDNVSLTNTDGTTPKNVAKCEFTPATALDLWEYAPTASTDNGVITNEFSPVYGSCTYNQMNAVNIGKSTVTFTNHVPGTGTTYNLDVEVISTQGVWNFNLVNAKGCNSVETATAANIRAGATAKFCISQHRKDSPRMYHAVSSNPTLLKVVSSDNAQYLELDAKGALDITEPVVVTVTMESSYYDTTSKPTVFTFTIIPHDVNPLGSWSALYTQYFPNTHIIFTDEDYNGIEGAKKGYIEDEIYTEEGSTGVIDKYYFYWTFKDYELNAALYAVDIKSYSGYSASDFVLYFYYQSSTGYYGVFLSAYSYDDEFELNYDYIILGGFAADRGTETYTPFVKD